MGISKDILKLNYIKNQKLLKKHHRFEIMFSTHVSDNDLYIVSIKNSHDSILKAKDLNRLYKDIQMVNNHMKNSTSLVIREIQIKPP